METVSRGLKHSWDAEHVLLVCMLLPWFVKLLKSTIGKWCLENEKLVLKCC